MKSLRPCLPAIVLVLAIAPVHAAEFSDQRVFTRQVEREKLDAIRAAMDREKKPEPETAATSALPVEKPPEVPEVRLQGFILRSDGPPAVWVNERNTLGGDRIDGNLQVESGRIQGQTVLIRLPDGRTVRLKPGQRFQPDSGRVTDVLQE